MEGTSPGKLSSIEYPEECVLGALLDSKGEFATFYEAERSKITLPVHWFFDPSLPERHSETERRNGEIIIRLWRVPAILEDAEEVAHELEHCVLREEGFPLTTSSGRFGRLSEALNSMLHDPIVMTRLGKFGFDVSGAYESEVKDTLRQITEGSDSLSTRYGRTLWILNYAQRELEWEAVRPASDGAESRFRSWFDPRYPEIAQEGQQLLDLVNSMGYNTPDKQYRLLERIFFEYELPDIFVAPFDHSSLT